MKIVEMSVGDDGLYMTKKRIKLHYLLNGAMIWGVIAFIGTLAFASFAYFQGQTFHGLDLIAYGGNTFKGYYTADLLRIEAGVCFASGVLFIVLYQSGFMWFYEKRSKLGYYVASIAIVVVSLIWEYFVVSIGVFDPISLINLLLAIVIFVYMKLVEIECKTIDLNV